MGEKQNNFMQGRVNEKKKKKKKKKNSCKKEVKKKIPAELIAPRGSQTVPLTTFKTN